MNKTIENAESKASSDVEIDISRVFKSLLKNIWLIALLAVIGAVLMFAYTAFVLPPEYKSTASVYIYDKGMNSSESTSDGSPNYNTTNSSVATYLQNTYIRTLTSNSTINKVIENLGIDYTVSQIKSMITYSVEDYPLFDITITSDDPQLSADIANELVAVLKQKVGTIVGDTSSGILDEPSVPQGKSGPSVGRNTLIGLVLGIVLACGIIVAVELLSNKIQDDEYLINRYGLAVLASITDHKVVSRDNTKSNKFYGLYQQLSNFNLTKGGED